METTLLATFPFERKFYRENLGLAIGSRQNHVNPYNTITNVWFSTNRLDLLSA